MARRLVSLTLDNLADLPAPCHDCAFWELDPALGRPPDPAFEKESWISDVLLQWGSCGLLIEVDGTTAGYALFAPPAYVPRSGAFATSPPAADAVLLAALRVDATYRGAGLGRVLVQGVAREVATRGLRAVEAFGHTGPGAARRPVPDSRGVPAGRRVQDRPPTPADSSPAPRPAQHDHLAGRRRAGHRSATGLGRCPTLAQRA